MGFYEEVMARDPLTFAWLGTLAGPPYNYPDLTGQGRNVLINTAYVNQPDLLPGLQGGSQVNFDDSSQPYIAHASWMDTPAVTAIVVCQPADLSSYGTIMAIDDSGTSGEISWRVRRAGAMVGAFFNGDAVGVNGDSVSRLTDSAGHGRHGLIRGASASATTGLVPGDSNGAIAVTGGTRGQVNYAPWMGTSGAFTASVLVKPASTPGSTYPHLMSRYNGASPFWEDGWVMRFDNGNVPTIYIFTGNSYVSAGAGTVSTGSTYLMTITYDGSVGKLYVDGTLVATTSSVSMNATTNPLTIGASLLANENFNGTVDEAAYWAGVALNATQIGDLQTARASGVQDTFRDAILALSPDAYYRLGETALVSRLLQVGVPTMIGYTLSPAGEKLYIDGELVDEAPGISPPVKTGALRLQRINPGEVFHGSFQAFALFGTRLSDADHRLLYQEATLTAPATSLPITNVDGVSIQYKHTDGDWYPVVTPGGGEAGLEIYKHTNLKRRWDASTLTGYADGDAIHPWYDDLVGWPMSQLTALNRPTFKVNIQNGLPVVRFDASDWMESNPVGTTETTIAIVRKVASTGASYVQAWNGDGLHGGGMLIYGGNRSAYVRAVAVDQGDAATTNWERWILCMSTTGGTRLFVDGEKVVDTASNMNTIGEFSARLGAADGADQLGGTPNQLSGGMDLGEALFFDAALSDSDAADLDASLAEKWG